MAQKKKILVLEECQASRRKRRETLDEEYRIEMVKCQNKLADFCAAFDIFQDKNAERIACTCQFSQVAKALRLQKVSLSSTELEATTAVAACRQRRQAALEAEEEARLQCNSDTDIIWLAVEPPLRDAVLNNCLSQKIAKKLLDCSTSEKALLEAEWVENEQKLQKLAAQGAAVKNGYGAKQLHILQGRARDEMHECEEKLKGCKDTILMLDEVLASAMHAAEKLGGREVLGNKTFVEIELDADYLVHAVYPDLDLWHIGVSDLDPWHKGDPQADEEGVAMQNMQKSIVKQVERAMELKFVQLQAELAATRSAMGSECSWIPCDSLGDHE